MESRVTIVKSPSIPCVYRLPPPRHAMQLHVIASAGVV